MKKLFLGAAAATLTLVGGGSAVVNSADADGARQLKATLLDTGGAPVGSAKISFESGTPEVKVEVQLPAAMAGFHGFHVHGRGLCEATPGAAPFTSAGAHLGEDPADPAERHRNHDGDLPVLLVNVDGRATARFETDRLDVAELLDADGAAFIIHAAPDNYANIPATNPANGAVRYSNPNAVAVFPNATTDATTLATGDAGSRIACGIIR